MNQRISRINGYTFTDLSPWYIEQLCGSDTRIDGSDSYYITVADITLNAGTFTSSRADSDFPELSVSQGEDYIETRCTCDMAYGALCVHGAMALNYILREESIRIFFDRELRNKKIKEVAVRYGLENDADVYGYFRLLYKAGSTQILPVDPALTDLQEACSIFPHSEQQHPNSDPDDKKLIVVLSQNRFYNHLQAGIYRCKLDRQGRPMATLDVVEPTQLLWNRAYANHYRFFSAISELSRLNDKFDDAARNEAIFCLIENNPGLPIFLHDRSRSENIIARSLTLIEVHDMTKRLDLRIEAEGSFYHLSGTLNTERERVSLDKIKIQLNHFFEYEGVLYISKHLQENALLTFMLKKGGKLLVHFSQFSELYNSLLSMIPSLKIIEKEAPAKRGQNSAATDLHIAKRLYLSRSDEYVYFKPVLCYGKVEVPLLSDRLLYVADEQGKPVRLQRDKALEDDFMNTLVRFHEHLKEQAADATSSLSIHKKHFLNEEWFVDCYYALLENDVEVFGFNDIINKKISHESLSVTINILSGVNWFNAEVNARFGRQKVNLKKIYKAVQNRDRYIKLDNGSMGILPSEWLNKFKQWFDKAAEIDAEMLGFAKGNYQDMHTLFDRAYWEQSAYEELQLISRQLANADEHIPTDISPMFRGSLREYQIKGVQWMTRLATLGMGGCLADDMGLGKTIQVIAFLLNHKHRMGALKAIIVLPTSLLFNWQEELSKFAPSFNTRVLHGKQAATEDIFHECTDILLTSYGIMISKSHIIRKQTFDFAFFDESQNIKNPRSQRYKAAAMLPARVKFVITGTPIENNLFDLYAQLSISTKGLLGGLQYFREVYSTPIDSFGDRQRAAELQERVSPFLLRRTKKEVLKELPEKTEMTIYCELEPSQRKVYDAYEREFRELVSAATEDELDKSPMHILRGITRLRQICNSPLLISGEKHLGEHSAKIILLMEHIRELAPQNKILIFSQFVSMLNLIARELSSEGIEYVQVDGKTSNRKQAIDTFQNESGTRVMLASLKAGGSGLNLTKADYVYLIEPWWNPAVEDQAIDRAYRLGRENKVIAIRLICRDTLEERMMEIKERKLFNADSILGTTSAMPVLNKKGLLQLLNSKLF